MTYSNAPAPRPPGQRNKTAYYLVGALVVIVILAIVFFMDQPDNTAEITVEPPATTEAPATGTTGTEPSGTTTQPAAPAQTTP